MSRRRRSYVLDLSGALPDPRRSPEVERATARVPDPGDRSALASLMLDAYRGTIDFEDETLEDAQREVDAYYSGRPLVSESSLLVVGEDLVAACLVSLWRRPERPLVSYVMTASVLKGKGLATFVLSDSLRRIRERGFREVEAVITEGNLPSEALFARLGFRGEPGEGT